MSGQTKEPNTPSSPLSLEWQRSPLHPVVLVAEDHDDTRYLYKYVLELNGYEVIEAVSGDDAVRLAEATHPDLVIMDTNLPRVDGLTATRCIRELPLLNDVPIVFISGDARPELRARALEVGGNDYLVKPLSISELEATVERTTGNLTAPGRQQS